MQLFLRDSDYTERLAAFLTSVGQSPVVVGPDRIDLDDNADDSLELEMYLRVWRVLYPDAEVELVAG